MSRDGVQVLSILGRDYSIRVPAGEALADAAALLQAEVDANKRKFLRHQQRVVVLSALNLCARQARRKRRRVAAPAGGGAAPGGAGRADRRGIELVARLRTAQYSCRCPRAW